MADIIEINIAVRGGRDVVAAEKSLNSMKRALIQVAQAERDGTLAAGSLEKATGQLTKKLIQQTGDAIGATKAMHGLKNELKQMTNQQLAAAAGLAASGKGMRRMEILAQQAGYQIGDFAVQVQSGTNAMVALGQQGSQLLGFFGPTGAIAGAGLAIATGLLAPLLNAKDAAKETKDEVKTLNDALSDLDAISKRVAVNVKSNLEEAFRNSSEAVRNLLNTLNELEFKATIKPIRKAMDDVALSVDKVDIAIKSMVGFNKLIKEGKTLDSVQKALLEDAEALVNENLVLALEFDKVKAALDNIGKSRTSKELAENFALAKAELEKVGGPAATQALTALEKIAKEAGIAEVIMNSLADAAGRLGDNLTFASDISPEVQARAVKLGVESGAIPPEALADLPQTEAEKAYQKVLEQRRKDARTKKKSPKEKETDLQKLERQLELEKALLGQTEARQRVMQALGVEFVKKNPEIIAGLEEQINAINALKEADEQRLAIQQTIEGALEDGFMSMIDGTKSVQEAFRDMARQVIAELYRILVVQKMVKSITTAFGFADGGVFQGGSQVKAFANGGVVGGPTYFPMSGGKTGLMGEAGPEAIMPLKRGKDGKLGVAADGGGGVTINQTFAFQANGDDSVKKIIAQAAPKIAAMTQQQIMDSRRRGGQMKQVFG